MRVLVIEDEAPLRKLLQRALSEEGFSVDLAADGEEGLYHAQTGEHDAIVLDLMIPKVPGLTILERLRAAGRATPVLILTARDGPSEKVAGLNRGADDYLTKPFSLEELIARLRSLIRRAHRNPSPAVRIADLEIDLAARRVKRAGQPIELRAKEYALLELLALRRGNVVSHSEIYTHVYASDSDTLSNVVDVHMCRLRSRIDRGFGAALIRTIRGQGYMLAEPG